MDKKWSKNAKLKFSYQTEGTPSPASDFEYKMIPYTGGLGVARWGGDVYWFRLHNI